MTALAAPRNTPERFGASAGFPIKANTTIFLGSIVVLDVGYAAPGRAAPNLIAVGCAEATVSAVAAGDSSVPTKRGTFKLANSASTDQIVQADVGSDCYIVDDQTVAKTSAGSTRSRAGKVVAVDNDGVWVQIGLGQ